MHERAALINHKKPLITFVSIPGITTQITPNSYKWNKMIKEDVQPEENRSMLECDYMKTENTEC